jgi:hypothetical protein
MKSNKNVDFYLSEMVSGNLVEVFAEKLSSNDDLIEKYEFTFKINQSTSKQVSLYIPDLYKIFVIVQKSLLKYIEENILNNVSDNKSIQLMVEAEGNDEKEISYKDKLYDYHLTRLAKKYTNVENEVWCKHTRKDLSHFLTFSKI